MTTGAEPHDAIVIGGGFYGAIIALYLTKQRGARRVLLIEREGKLFSRASYNNQARVHNGYHYTRSFTTAYRSRVNYPLFVREWHEAVGRDFTQLYAIARNSKVTAFQFERFCRGIGAKFTVAGKELRSLFDQHLVEQVYAVEECSFDAVKLAAAVGRELRKAGVDVVLSSRVLAVEKARDALIAVDAEGGRRFLARHVFNCTYSGLNQIAGAFSGTRALLKHEVTELALIRAPSALANIGATVIDGPFFSTMPFPAQGLQTLSHVRYTPHYSREDRRGQDPYEMLDAYDKESRVDRMIRDAARYMPAMRTAEPVASLFEVKTVLVKSEGDDGRPILLEKCDVLPNFYSILGGKIDNIYDVLRELDSETLFAA